MLRCLGYAAPAACSNVRSLSNTIPAPRLGALQSGVMRGAVFGMMISILAACGDEAGREGASQSSPGSDECSARGQVLFTSLQCSICHLADSPSAKGGPLAKLHGTPVTLADGTQLIRDDDYLFRSIRSPGDEIVEGFSNDMPSYPTLSDEDIRCLVEHVKSLP